MAPVLMEVDQDGVAVITINNPPVNSLAIEVLRPLADSFLEAHKRQDVKAIVVIGANGKFSGGFDIPTIVNVQRSGDLSSLPRVSVDLMQNIIEAGPKPAVAAIDGLALGGGLELAMSCHTRVCAPGAQLGLPELQLGIIPGFGGTQRLPRLVGLQKAIEMMLLSKPIKADEAKRLGLVDELVPAGQLLAKAKEVALDIVGKRRPWLLTLHRTDKLEPLSEARDIIAFARAQVQKTAPNVPHPSLCLDAIEEGIVAGGVQGVLKEEAIFQKVVISDTAQALAHIFLAMRQTSKVPGVSDLNLQPQAVRKVAVIGGGLMGSGIATALLLAGLPVIIKEVNQEFLQQGLDRVKGNLASRVKKGKMTEDKMQKMLALLKGTLDYEEFGRVDLVIEAVIENINLKQEIFRDLERVCAPSCVLASNTSTIDLNLVGAKTNAQDRIIGAHFFSPAHVMPLLEIVRTDKTSPQVILDLLGLSKAIRKTPVVVGNCTGFAVNRVFFPYTMAACLLVDLGMHPYHIDRVVKKFGMPMGPFRLCDLVGMQVSLAVGMQFRNAFPDRSYNALLVKMMVDDRRLGERTGKGFYLYDDRRRERPAPELEQYLEKSRKAASIMPDGKPIQLSDQEIIEAIFFPVVNEACRVIEEGVVVRPSDLDVATMLGFGFPPYRGGVAFWGDLVGAKYVHDSLNRWSLKFGGFFKPSKYLQECAFAGRQLSDGPSSSGQATLARL